jgi:hypothetical protein
MADLEARIAMLEHDMAAVKERIGRQDEQLVNLRKAQPAPSEADANVDAELQHDLRMSIIRKQIADAVREVFDERDRRGRQ